MSSIITMGFARQLAGKFFSEIGVSVIGAVTHNLAQLLVAYALLVKNDSILLLAPVMILTAIGTGVVNGIATKFLITRMRSSRF
jgi:heptaprenyl diphosphate synthase